MFNTPLESFQIMPIGPCNLITNQTITFLFLFLVVVTAFFAMCSIKDNTLYFIPTRYQFVVEAILSKILLTVKNTIQSSNSVKFFPLIFSFFLFVASLNSLGLIPGSFAVTGQFITMFIFSFSIFAYANAVSFNEHGFKMFSMFLPTGTSFALSFFIIPLEALVYMFRPLAMGIRMVCNVSAGHLLLALTVNTSWYLIHCTDFLFYFQYVPLIIVPFLVILELSIAVVQAYIFSLLICVYLNDAIRLDH